MLSRSASALLALTFAMTVGFASVGFAKKTAPADGQTVDNQVADGQAVEGQAVEGQAVEPPPKPDAGTTAQLNCIDEGSTYDQNRSGIFYVQTLENKCEARMSCKVFVYSLNARGPAHGHATLILAPKSAGAKAKSSYRLKVKGAGGFTSADRECRAL